MRTILLEQPEQLRLLDAKPPEEPGPGEALVRVGHVGVCGTDLHAFKGKQPFFDYPRILGHELGVALDEEIPRFRAAVRDGDFDTAMIWAGEVVDLISDVASAGELVRRIGVETEACMRHASELLRKT